MKLTPQAARRLAAEPGEHEIVFDDQIAGFGLRRGSSWVFQYKIGDQHRRITFGKFPAMDVGRARETAIDLHAAVRLGSDPQREKIEARTQAGESLEACVARYLPWQRTRVRPISFKENVRHLMKNLAPLHGLHIDAIDRRAIAMQLQRLTEDIGARQANATRASLAKFLDWAMREGLVERNEALLTNKNAENRRDRVLSEAELVDIWRHASDDNFGKIVRMLLLTGQRRTEIGDLRWDEIDFDGGTINLPARRVKNARDHSVPLSGPALELLKTQPRMGDFVFGGRGAAGYNGYGKAKRELDEVVRIPEWILHDIRRSVVTHMAELGVLPHIIEAVVNHVSGHKGGIAGVYNHARYEAEKRAALDLWAAHVMKLCHG